MTGSAAEEMAWKADLLVYRWAAVGLEQPPTKKAYMNVSSRVNVTGRIPRFRIVPAASLVINVSC